VITVTQPDISRAVNNPMTFDFQFRAAPGSAINPSTFQAKYGWLGIDITNRLLDHATRTPNGLFAANVNVPTGNHRITVSIADNRGRVGTRAVNLHVLRIRENRRNMPVLGFPQATRLAWVSAS